MDLSCGSGLFTRKLAASGLFRHVVASDYSEAMLGQARGSAERAGTDTDIRRYALLCRSVSPRGYTGQRRMRAPLTLDIRAFISACPFVRVSVCPDESVHRRAPPAASELLPRPRRRRAPALPHRARKLTPYCSIGLCFLRCAFLCCAYSVMAARCALSATAVFVLLVASLQRFSTATPPLGANPRYFQGSLDAIHAGAALHCWPSPTAALAEISRVLRPGGVFVASTFLTPVAPLGEVLGDAAVEPLSQARRGVSLSFSQLFCLVCGGGGGSPSDVTVGQLKMRSTPSIVRQQLILSTLSLSFLSLPLAKAVSRRTNQMRFWSEPEIRCGHADIRARISARWGHLEEAAFLLLSCACWRSDAAVSFDVARGSPLASPQHAAAATGNRNSFRG